MQFINYEENRRIKNDVRKLYVSAFPIEERPPVNTFFKIAELNNDELFGIYDNNEFVGFTNLIFYQDICYIFFLAVVENKRNQGYGSKILKCLQETYKDKVLTLCYEEIDEKYLDLELRKRRKDFYYRNGFKDNEMKTCEYGVNYETCYYGSHKVNFSNYLNLYKSVFGDRVKKIIKEINKKGDE